MYKRGMTISEVLADYLARGDLTQDDAARILGVTQPTVQRWVVGKDTPSNRYVPAIVQMTGLSERKVIDAIHAQKLKARSLSSRVTALESEVLQMRSDLREVLALLRDNR
jgi:predicted transcriptional regulator